MSLAPATEPLLRIQDAFDVIRETADASEAARCLSSDAHAAMAAAGVFDLVRPRAYGGEEVDLLTLCRVIRDISRVDGSAGWCAMISGVYGAFGGMLPHKGAEEIFAPGSTVIAGALGPGGMAERVEGGYRLSGRWPFASNSPHANWFVAGALVTEGGQPVIQPHGAPILLQMFLPREEVEIIDVWQTTGLKATSSNDYTITDAFVPAHRTFAYSDPPTNAGTLYQMPLVASFGTAISAVSLGIARHALDIVQAMAATKSPVLSPVTMQHKPNVQDRVGVALANVNAAEAYLERAISYAWARAEAGERFDWADRGPLWLAATHCAQVCVEAVNALYTVGGGSSVFAANALDRCLRDIRTASQHVMTQYLNYEVAGKQFLGLPVHDTIWSFDYRP